MLKATKVVGLNSDQSAAQVLIHHLVSGLSEGTSTLDIAQPSLFIVAKCSLDDAFTKVRQALYEAETIFYQSSEAISLRMEQALTALKNNLAESADLQVILVATHREALSSRVLYLLCQGSDLSALLMRSGSQTDLCQMGSSSRIVSGFLKEGDRLVITTSNLLDLLGEHSSALTKVPIEELEDEIMSSLPHDKVSPLAAIILEEEIIETPQEIERKPIASLLQEAPQAESAGRATYIYRARVGVWKTLLFSKRSAAIALIILVVVGGAVVGLRFLGGLSGTPLISSSVDLQAEYQKAAEFKNSDLEEYKTQLESVKSQAEQVLQSKPDDNQAQTVKRQAEADLQLLSKSHFVKDIGVWLDLNLVREGFMANRLAVYEDQLLLLDQSKQVLITVSLDSKSHKILAGGDKIGQASLQSLNADSVWVYSADKGVLRLDVQSTQVVDTIEPDQEWGKISDIYGFASNVYLLDTGKNQIWKYLPIASGFSDKREYFSSDTATDLKDGVKMHIDGSIWILKSNGQLLKFTQGNADSFNLNGVEPAPGQIKSFFISDNTNKIYLLDGQNQRVAVVNKDGSFDYQIVSDKFTTTDDLVADESTKKLYLLEGSKIYSIDLQ